MPRRPKYFVHVDSSVIRNNRETGACDPPIIVRDTDHKELYRLHSLEFEGLPKIEFTYHPDMPFPDNVVVSAIVWEDSEGFLMERDSKKDEGFQYMRCLQAYSLFDDREQDETV